MPSCHAENNPVSSGLAYPSRSFLHPKLEMLLLVSWGSVSRMSIRLNGAAGSRRMMGQSLSASCGPELVDV